MDLHAALADYLRDRLAVRDARIAAFTRISDGWENEVYSFTLQHETGNGSTSEDLVLRIYPGDDAVSKATREFAVMNRLFQLGYPVPEPRVLEATGSVLGKPFLIMHKIEGEPLGAVIRRSSIARKRELIDLFCATLVRLHALDWRPFVDDPDQYRASGFVERWLARVRPLVDELAPGQFGPALEWLAARVGRMGTARLALVHWDYHAQNVLLTERGDAFVIDWTSAEVTDYRFDLGWTLLLEGTYHGWPMREAILHTYERIAGSPVEQVEFFEVVACLRRLVSILVSLRLGAERLGMRPEAVATMRAQHEHITDVYAILTYRIGVMLPAVEALLDELRSGAAQSA